MPNSHDLQFVYKGDRLTAEQVNAIIRAAQHHPPCKHVPHDPPWYNDAATACPEYGVAAVTGTTGDEGDKMAKCAQPTTLAAKQYIVNIDDELDAADEGNYQNGEWVLALYDTGTPALDETWIPKSGQWTLTKGEAGAPWGIVVAGIVDSTNKILLGKIVEVQSEFVFHNSGGAEAPAYGVMGVSGVDGTSPDVVPKTAKPSATYRRDYLVNSQVAIADDARGNYQNHPELLALYYTSGTPALNELWGPTEGQWYLSKGSTGNGDANTTKTRADWGVIVAGIKDSTNKILVGKQVPYGMAKRCRGLLKGALTDATSSTTVDTVTTVSPGWAPVAAAADELTVHSVFAVKGFAGPDNGVCYFEWNESESRWEFYDVECP